MEFSPLEITKCEEKSWQKREKQSTVHALVGEITLHIIHYLYVTRQLIAVDTLLQVCALSHNSFSPNTFIFFAMTLISLSLVFLTSLMLCVAKFSTEYNITLYDVFKVQGSRFFCSLISRNIIVVVSYIWITTLLLLQRASYHSESPVVFLYYHCNDYRCCCVQLMRALNLCVCLVAFFQWLLALENRSMYPLWRTIRIRPSMWSFIGYAF